MKTLRTKVAVLIATLALAMGCGSAMAFADATIPSDGGVITSSDATLNIQKTLKVSNPDLAQVAGPGLHLTYSLAPTPAPAGSTVITTIEDEHGNTAEVHSGPTDGLTLVATPNYTTSELLNASATGTANIKNIQLQADTTKFTAPGVYRYTLTDTTPAETLTTLGIDRNADFTNVRYVDVYIQQGTSGLVVEGYVVGSDNDGNGVLVKETFDYSTTTDDTTDAAYKTTATPDVFGTYNVTLQKTVTGAMGDRNHQFPFNIYVSDSSRQYYAGTVAPTSTTSPNQAIHTTDLTANLKHGEFFYVAGLKKNDRVGYREQNDTSDTYAVSVNVNGTAGTSTKVAPGGYKAMDSDEVTDIASVVFNNNHESVSPTGVVMQYGPYIGMVLIAILFIALRRRAKANK